MAMTSSEVIGSLAIIEAVLTHMPDTTRRAGISTEDIAALDEAIAIVESFDAIKEWCHGRCSVCAHNNDPFIDSPCGDCICDHKRPYWQFRWPERKETTNDKH